MYMCPCYVHAPWMSIRVFSNEWIFRLGYYHGHCINTSTRVAAFFVVVFSLELENHYLEEVEWTPACTPPPVPLKISNILYCFGEISMELNQ